MSMDEDEAEGEEVAGQFENEDDEIERIIRDALKHADGMLAGQAHQMQAHELRLQCASVLLQRQLVEAVTENVGNAAQALDDIAGKMDCVEDAIRGPGDE